MYFYGKFNNRLRAGLTTKVHSHTYCYKFRQSEFYLYVEHFMKTEHIFCLIGKIASSLQYINTRRVHEMLKVRICDNVFD